MKLASQVLLHLCVVGVFFAGCSSTPVSISITPQSANVFATQSVQFTATDSRRPSDVSWTVTASSGQGGASPESAVIDSNGNFTAPAVTQNTNYTVTATSKADHTKSASATVTVVASGQVTATNQPQVALYSLTAPSGTSMFVQFSTDTSYGLKTWTQPAPMGGGPLSTFVAGMLANTQYHMRAVLQAADGSSATDVDHTFTTAAIPANQMPHIQVSTTAGATPQPGVELLDLLLGQPAVSLAAVDLSGNLLWSYPVQGTNSDLLQGVHLLPNGHFLMDISPNSTDPISPGTIVANTIDVLREIDLTGATIREESVDALNAALPGAGFNFTVQVFHHDVIALPNGHWIAIGNVLQPCVGLAICSTYPNLLGDVIIDLAPQSDGTFLPVWTWNTIDHLDPSRAPMGYPDWTHSNAVLYSPDDGNLLFSMRHQGWIIKIDYNNGKGAGDIIWRLGKGGDFQLLGGTDPQDWFYAQHGPSFATTNTTGNFQLTVMDNGNSRLYPSGQTCQSLAFSICPYYSTSELLQIDESAKTATLLYHYAPGLFSVFGGNAEELTNGNIESDFNAGGPTGYTEILETTNGADPQVVWSLQTTNQYAYRGFRMGSLYPGVQW